jgi:hypothetical protein
MPDHRTYPLDLAREYPPYAVGMDPVTPPPETGARLASAPANFAEILTPGAPEKRDPYFENPIMDGQPVSRRSDYSLTTWAMIVIAGIVFGAAIALIAAGA